MSLNIRCTYNFYLQWCVPLRSLCPLNRIDRTHQYLLLLLFVFIMICYILISTFGPSIAQVLSILTQLFILVWKLVAFYPAGGYIHLSNIQCRNRIYDHSDDWVLLCRFDILVYCVQSAGRPLRRINRHFVTVLSVIPSYTWTEWCHLAPVLGNAKLQQLYRLSGQSEKICIPCEMWNNHYLRMRFIPGAKAP